MMDKPDGIEQWAWDRAVELHNVAEAGIIGPFHTLEEILPYFAHALMEAKAEQREADAQIADETMCECGPPQEDEQHLFSRESLARRQGVQDARITIVENIRKGHV